jgi:protein SCO1
MKSKWISINSFLMALLIFSCSHSSEAPKRVLPIYGEKHLSTTDTIFHTLPNFKLTNQYNEIVTNETVKNKIYVADFFFATCQSICPQMSKQLTRVQDAFAKNDSVLILSHTVNPMHDSVKVLNDYAQRYNAIKGKWHFLTGDKKTIYDLAKTGYLVNALEDDGSAEGFLHSELLLLMDSKQRIRGMYDGTDEAAVSKLIADTKLLLTEKE